MADAQGRPVPAQLEKESCNIQIDQRKRIVFRARLAPSVMTRVSCRLREVPRSPAVEARPITGRFELCTGGYEIEIDGATGLISRYAVESVEFLQAGACRALVMKDSADPWGMKVRSFRENVGEFRPVPAAAARPPASPGPNRRPCGSSEDGEVRRGD
jgi:alpha-mannosidase